MSDLSTIEVSETSFTSFDHTCLYNESNNTEEKSLNQPIKDMLEFLHDSDVEDSENCSVSHNNDIGHEITEDMLSKTNECLPETTFLDVPVKQNKKFYERNKIKLLGETQRLIRETPTESFKYKPKQYKTFGEFSQVLQSKKQSQNTQKIEIFYNELDKENMMAHIDDSINITASECDELIDTLPMIDRIVISDSTIESQFTQPEFLLPNDFAKKAADFLKKKNNNAVGVFELKSRAKYGQAKRGKEDILKNLRKSIDSSTIIVEKDSFTNLDTIVKTVDPDTGDVILESKTIIVKKDKRTKIVQGIDPAVATKMEATMSEKQLLEWTQMSKHKKYEFLKKTLLTEAAEKRKVLRGKRLGDVAVSVNVKKSPKKANDRDGLSDDDTEWEDNKEDNSDSEEETTDSECEEDSDSEEDEIVIGNKGHVRVGVIEDDDDDDEEDYLEQERIEPFVDIREKDVTDVSYDKSLLEATSFNGSERSRRRCQLSPILQVDPTLCDVVLPERATSLIAALKLKYGLSDVDRSVLLLPTMKTTTVCIENLLKQQLVKDKYLSPSTLSTYEKMVSDNAPVMHATWEHNFNLLTSVKLDDYDLASYSFLNSSVASSRLPEKGVKTRDLDDTLVMEGSMTVQNEDDTLVLSKEETSPREGTTFSSSETNVIHAKLFGCADTKEHHSSDDLSTSATKVFANLSYLMNDSQVDVEGEDGTEGVGDDHDGEDGTEGVGDDHDGEDGTEGVSDDHDGEDGTEGVGDDHEDKDGTEGVSDDHEGEDGTEGVGDDHDGEDGTEGVGDEHEGEDGDSECDTDSVVIEDDREESLTGKMDYDEDDDEEIYRKRVQKGTKFRPTDYIDEEAELSGSDAEEYGSDEDERGLDEYEDEEGDLEKLPSEGKLRRQIERIHNKLEIDQDAHDIRYIKEMYLEDGDLNMGDEGPRKKRFAWDDLNDSEGFSHTARSSDDDESEYEDLAATVTVDEASVEPEEQNDDGLIDRYDKFLVGKRSAAVDTLESEQVRPAWSTDSSGPSVTPAPPSIKRHGSMLHRTLSTHVVDKPVSKTANDLDLKTRMSVMFAVAPRPTETLKRGPSDLRSCAVPKKPKTDDV